MSGKTTNLLGIVITIVAGTYFNIMLCNTGSAKTEEVTKNRKLVEKKMIIRTLTKTTDPKQKSIWKT